ncbi:DUF3221 domain-containing protein [Pallidibacillus pasinlerensis]|uniref:DUF3221 domain-containing protein n=1 Tax=Pallidibacillus pasinlerensis TaxID=2703818 RepID=A0ABX0A794_9BACI|nr:DUF3221 domain-containing protein [Pallidibacillus pasinlerensis]NCU18692.1 DUF3221 domain-containing protein [Pallidibacillus pasinlerensis]
MKKLFSMFVILLLFTLIGCGNSNDGKNDTSSVDKDNLTFIGTIKEINGDTAIVSAVLVEGNPEGDVFVDLSVNKDETFQVGDKIKVEFDGVIRESNPAQINTLSVELIE